MKASQNRVKVVVLGRLLVYCKIALTAPRQTDQAEASEILFPDEERDLVENTPDLSQFDPTKWTKECAGLCSGYGFFLHIYLYRVESRDDIFDAEKKEAYKNLKGYRYYDGGLVPMFGARLLTIRCSFLILTFMHLLLLEALTMYCQGYCCHWNCC